jgi:hypothetical protein
VSPIQAKVAVVAFGLLSLALVAAAWVGLFTDWTFGRR